MNGTLELTPEQLVVVMMAHDLITNNLAGPVKLT